MNTKNPGQKEDGLLIQDGSITGTVKNPQNLDRLYLSVPYDKGWSVKGKWEEDKAGTGW